MKHYRWGIIVLTGIIILMCLQVLRTQLQLSPTPTTSSITPHTIEPSECTPVVVTRVATPTRAAESTPGISDDKTLVYERISALCSIEECMFETDYALDKDYPIGTATIAGYYTQIEKAGFDDIEHVCDSFVIVGGSQAIIESVLALVNSGNSVYSKNERNQPVISLDLATLNELETEHILNSTPDKPVEIIVLANSPTYMGVGACFTRFEILRVKK